MTLLQILDENTAGDGDKVELFCNVLTGRTVDWSKEIGWVHCVYGKKQRRKVTMVTEDGSGGSGGSAVSVAQPKVFNRKRLYGKSEFEMIEQLSKNFFACLYSIKISEKGPGNIRNLQSVLASIQLSGKNVYGTMLGKLWKSTEELFVEGMNNSFFYRRIIFSELEPFAYEVNTFLDKILNKPNVQKLEVVEHLQSVLFEILNRPSTNVDVTPDLLLTLSNVKSLLVQMTNEKIDKCRAFVKNEPFQSWFGKQTEAMTMVYQLMLQSKVRNKSVFFF